MPPMRLFGCHQVGQTGRSPEIQVQELRQPFHLPSERHQQKQPLRVVRMVDTGQADARADTHVERIQPEAIVPMVRRVL